MEKNELLRKYELVVIVDYKLTAEEKEQVIKGVSDTVTKAGCKIINSQVWLEKQKFTFDIKKCKEGAYYLINFEAGPDAEEKISPILKLNEKVLRYSIIKVKSNATQELAKT